MSPVLTEPTADRRLQILNAAMTCFAKRGFHQTSMHDISAEASISVGLIYRYFDNKEAVIDAMATRHHSQVQQLLAEARDATSLLEALEIFFTAHCAGSRQIQAAFVVDLYAESSRNPRFAVMLREILEHVISGVAELIAQSPEARCLPEEISSRQASEIIFATLRGTLMRDALDLPPLSEADQHDRQLTYVRQLWRLLFRHAHEVTLS